MYEFGTSLEGTSILYLNPISCWYNRSSDKPLSEVNKLIYTSSLLEIFVLDGYLNTKKWFQIAEIGVFTVPWSGF